MDSRHTVGPFYCYVFGTNKKAPNGAEKSIGASNTVLLFRIYTPVKFPSKGQVLKPCSHLQSRFPAALCTAGKPPCPIREIKHKFPLSSQRIH